MNFGKCVFKGCRKEAGACVEDDGKPVIVCSDHYWELRDLHTKDIIEEAFKAGGGQNVRIHDTSIQQ